MSQHVQCPGRRPAPKAVIEEVRAAGIAHLGRPWERLQEPVRSCRRLKPDNGGPEQSDYGE